ncbi:MAG TPA: caspase family protein [Candidatus Cloacimonadota bacterium]|nr:caspase family protein [Candidatus Cloacimonadota bacterium]
MNRWVRFVFVCTMLLLITCLSATERHIALIVGNADYSVGPLRNPVNDANAMEAALTELGFEVTKVLNLKKNMDFVTIVKTFVDKLGPKDVGLFFYAGHGMQLNDKNYLIPTRAIINSETEIEFEGYDLDRLLVDLQSKSNAMNIVILDACRDNPFARSFRSGARGLAMVDRSVPDCLIAYSTEPGGVASDGDGDNGLFTEELVKAIRTPEMDLTDIMMNVRQNVKRRSDNKQLPWETSLLTKKFSFYKGIYGGDFPKPYIKLSNPWKAQKWIGTSAVVLNALALAYFQTTADSKYDQYKKANTVSEATNLHKQAESNLRNAKFSGYFLPIPIGHLLLSWWQDGKVKARERELNKDKF